jgi:hypothetical protein
LSTAWLKVPVVLSLPDNLKVEAALAIGYQGDKSTLSEALQAREAPSQRQPLSDMVFKGHFTGEIKVPT